MRETLKGLVTAVAWSALWILPLPFGTFVSRSDFLYESVAVTAWCINPYCSALAAT